MDIRAILAIIYSDDHSTLDSDEVEVRKKARSALGSWQLSQTHSLTDRGIPQRNTNPNVRRGLSSNSPPST